MYIKINTYMNDHKVVFTLFPTYSFKYQCEYRWHLGTVHIGEVTKCMVRLRNFNLVMYVLTGGVM